MRMRWSGGHKNGDSTEPSRADPAASRAVVMVAGETFEVAADRPFIFGRCDAEGIVGLDQNDMGISAVAGSVEAAWGVWWVINQSTKRPLQLEHAAGQGQLKIAPGHRHALTTDELDVIVVGAIYTHVLQITLPDSYVAELRGGLGRLTTGTLTGESVNLTERDRNALTALCAGYLESFPHRREHPNTYEEAARLLGAPWTGAKVRKAVERVRERFANKGLYFDGPQANYELAAYLIGGGVLSGEDLVRLPARRRA